MPSRRKAVTTSLPALPRVGETVMPSAELASESAVADLLILDEIARINKLTVMLLVFLPLVMASLLVFDGEPAMERLFATTLGLSIVAAAIGYHITREPSRFRIDLTIVGLAILLAAIAVATLYFGPFSPVAVISAFAVLFTALSGYAVIGILGWLGNALVRIALVALLASGVLEDRGLIALSGRTAAQMLAYEALVQAVLAMAYLSGVIAHRSTHSKVRWLMDVVRTAARRELDIANQLQTSILPGDIEVSGYETSASMLPAAEVGGDYYDIRPTEHGCWIGIGDVSGHGLSAGLIMVMVQTAVAALTSAGAHSITEIVEGVNRVVHGNVRLRLRSEDFVTFSLLELRTDGRVTAAGRHEPILVHRATTGRVETFDPEGRQRFGFDRLLAAVVNHAALPVAELRAALEREVSTFAPKQTDDVTLVVARYVGRGTRTV